MAKLSLGQIFVSGLAGAVSVTLVNETARQLISNAPRLEELGIRGIARGLRKTGQDVPSRDSLFWLSLAGDLASNSLYYSLVGWGSRSTVWARGVALASWPVWERPHYRSRWGWERDRRGGRLSRGH